MVNLGVPHVNWNQGSSFVSNEMSFDEKVLLITKKSCLLAISEGMRSGDLLYVGGLSDRTHQTFHKPIENVDGLFISKDIKKISRLVVCQNFRSNYKKFKLPLRLINGQVMQLEGNTLVPLYKENRDWLMAENAYEAMSKVAGESYGDNKAFECVKIMIHSRMYPIEHLAFVYRGKFGKNFYCLLDSGFVFEATSEEVSEVSAQIGFEKEASVSGDFVQYKNIEQNEGMLKFVEK